MGRFWSVMKSVLRAMASAPRWVWRQCRESGKLVLEALVMPIDMLMGNTGVATIDKVPEADTLENTTYERLAGVSVVKKVATQILGGEVNDKDLQMLPERVIKWLSALDRKQLARVVCANDYAVQEHLERKGNGIAGVLEFDKQEIKKVLRAMDEKQALEDAARARREARWAEHQRETRRLEEQRKLIRLADKGREFCPGYGI